MAEEEPSSLQYTPTWVIATVCFLIVFISIMAERGLHHLGKYLKQNEQDALFEALQKLKDELMLLGFISLLLTVFQGPLSRMCVPAHVVSNMLPCKRHENKSHEQYSSQAVNNRRRLFSEDSSLQQCSRQGKVPFLPLEAVHQLHIFIFVLAVVHAIFCVMTMGLGGARIRRWRRWEKEIAKHRDEAAKDHTRHHYAVFAQHGQGLRKNAVVSWTIAFFRQFCGSITKSDYIALRHGFITTHIPHKPEFDFNKYIMRTLEVDFKKVVGISWYLWLFVVVFLLLNVKGWNTYFWLSFLPVVLLLIVGTKLEHIIIQLAQDLDLNEMVEKGETAAPVKPSDEHFWFNKPGLILLLIHFILFQNAFELAFFFWILSTYGFHSCIMEKLSYIITRLIMGVMVQVLCSNITLPLYAIVTQMGSRFKEGMFHDMVHSSLMTWLSGRSGATNGRQMDRIVKESYESIEIVEQQHQSHHHHHQPSSST